MSATATTKVFGMKLAIDPKILVGVLVVIAGVIFWYNSRSDETPAGSSKPVTTRLEVPTTPLPAAAAPAKSRVAVRRTTNQQLTSDRATLRLRPVDATRGDIDPTLHLDLLSRLQAVTQTPSTRSLFEIGAIAIAGTGPGGATSPIKGPVIIPKPIAALPPTPPVSTTPPPPVVNIPLRYYGFVRPAEIGRTNSGLFLDGDNVVVATEGQVVKQRFLIVELTPTNARVEDTQLRQGQTLPVMPVANP